MMVLCVLFVLFDDSVMIDIYMRIVFGLVRCSIVLCMQKCDSCCLCVVFVDVVGGFVSVVCVDLNVSYSRYSLLKILIVISSFDYVSNVVDMLSVVIVVQNIDFEIMLSVNVSVVLWFWFVVIDMIVRLFGLGLVVLMKQVVQVSSRLVEKKVWMFMVDFVGMVWRLLVNLCCLFMDNCVVDCWVSCVVM